jgi:hypothetical protein
VSERLQRAREDGVVLLDRVIADAADAFDLAAADALIAVLGAGGHVHGELVRVIAARAVEALDSEDLVAILWQAKDQGLLESPVVWGPRQQPRLEDILRGTIQAVVHEALRAHLAERAEGFTREAA